MERQALFFAWSTKYYKNINSTHINGLKCNFSKNSNKTALEPAMGILNPSGKK